MGAGINLFRQLFPEDYYAYQTATLISSKPVSKVIKDSNDATIATYPLGGDELRGLLKVENGQLVAYGDVKDSSGQIQRIRGQSVYDGSVDESWSDYNSSYDGFYILNNDMKVDSDNPSSQLIADKAVVSTIRGSATISGVSIKTFGSTSDYGFFFLCGTGETTVAGLRTWLSNNNLTIEYPLITPTTSSGTAFTNPMISGSTEEFTDSRSLKMFVGHQSQYYTETEGDKLAALPEVTGEQGDFIINNADGKMTLKKRNVYSETEHLVGTWIDGSPLYEKTKVDQFSSGDTECMVGISSSEHIDKIIDISGFVVEDGTSADSKIIGWNDTAPNSVFYYLVSFDTIIIGRDDTSTFGDEPTIYITIRYTKTS